MNPWLISGLCCAGAGLIAWGSVRLSLRWPLIALAGMLAVIAAQLYLAARGQDGFHDLAAVTAQTHTVIPALAGMLAGLALAAWGRHPMPVRGPAGLVVMAALALAAGLAAATLLI